ncbi:bifunctional peptidase and (3S)-lysyl hydroxylase JMJD7-like [Bolinopsis microptera]|uniref:bifunctional peptidase and (3S)-lysyl hydroxylase JMJD7-like n=1 Tax=Bolinopsis microptera TaxID=2820187 RepID=UPI00307907FE
MLHILHYILQLLGFYEQLPLGQQSPALPVPVIQGFLKPTEFFRDYVIPGRPVVFKGAAREFRAFQRWTDDYFLSFEESTKWMIQYELGKKETREGGQEPIPFADYIKRYNEEDLYCVTGLPKFLRGDLPIFGPLRCKFVLTKLMDDLVMWFSSGGTKSVWHYDDYENLNCLIKGKKQLILANRSEMELGHFKREGSFSSVDVDSVNLNKYPGFGEITFYNATIEAGDCVYIPTFWGHTVRSWGRNIAINAWWEIYKTPFECISPDDTDWGSVSMTTDSDIGKAGEEEIKDTEGARELSGNLRLVMWSSLSMRTEGRVPKIDFLDALSAVKDDLLDLLETVIGDSHDLTDEEWLTVFDQLDANKDEHLDPTEIDLISNDETLIFLIRQAKIESLARDSDRAEL